MKENWYQKGTFKQHFRNWNGVHRWFTKEHIELIYIDTKNNVMFVIDRISDDYVVLKYYEDDTHISIGFSHRVKPGAYLENELLIKEEDWNEYYNHDKNIHTRN